MALKNVLIAVSDIDRSKKFYHDLFGLTVLREFEGNAMLTEGLALQGKGLWTDISIFMASQKKRLLWMKMREVLLLHIRWSR